MHNETNSVNRRAKRQHHLPQLLLAGFCSRRAGKQAYTYAFTRGREPEERNIKNVGVEGGFYTIASDDSIDHAQTALEGRFASLLERARASGTVEDPTVAEFVANLLIRGRHFRGLMQGFAQRAVSALRATLANPDAVREWVRDVLAQRPGLIEPLSLKLGWGPVDHLPEPKKAVLRGFVEGMIVRELPQQLVAQSDNLDQLERELSSTDGLKPMHLNPLRTSVSPPVRVDRLAALSWSIVELAPQNLILGDVGVLRRRHDRGEYDIALDAAADDQLFLPLSHDRLLIGHSGGHAVQLDVESLNTAASELSIEFFVACRDSTRERQYHRRLGGRVESIFELMLGQLKAHVDS
jgi:hypothetical protein